jgi:hypothetical protein
MATSDVPDDEEAARLRREVEELRQQLDDKESPEPGDRRGWWRPLVAGLLIAIAALLAPVSVVATWARDEIEDTNRYVETITPLASDPAVQQAIATRIQTEIYNYIDLDQITQDVVNALDQQNLPPRAVATLDAVSGPLASAIRGFINDRIDALVQSDLFEQAWIEANRQAHTQMVAVLTGEGTDSVSVSGGEVSVSVAAVIDTIKDELVKQGFGLASRIPPVNASFVIFQSDDLTKAQGAFSLLDDIATWLPVFGLLLIVIAVFVARDRRRALLAAGLALAASMILLGAILNLLRPIYLDALPADTSTAAAGAVYDTLVGFIRTALRAVLVVSLVIAVVAWLWAPTGAGAAARRGLGRGVGALRSGRARAGLRTGAFGEALANYRNAVRVGVIGLAALIYLLKDHPTAAYALTVVAVTVVILVIAEVLAAPPAESGKEPDATEPAAKEPEAEPAPVTGAGAADEGEDKADATPPP